MVRYRFRCLFCQTTVEKVFIKYTFHYVSCPNMKIGVKLDKILLRESTNPPKVNDKLGFLNPYRAFKSFL